MCSSNDVLSENIYIVGCFLDEMINFEKKIFGQQLVTKLLPHIGLVWENRVTLGDFLKNRDAVFKRRNCFSDADRILTKVF